MIDKIIAAARETAHDYDLIGTGHSDRMSNAFSKFADKLEEQIKPPEIPTDNAPSLNDQLRRDIAYNATDMGELGTFIRTKYLHNILERYIITDRNRINQLGRLDLIRETLRSLTAGNERQALEAIYRIVNP